MKILPNILFSYILTTLVSCSSLKVVPLQEIASISNCYQENSNPPEYPIELELKRRGALKSKKIVLRSDFGMHEKTIQLFIQNKREVTFAFHFLYPIDIDLKSGQYIIKGDAGTLERGRLHIDHDITIGEVTEKYLYLTYPFDKMGAFANDSSIIIKIDPVTFNIPFACREEMREILNNI